MVAQGLAHPLWRPRSAAGVEESEVVATTTRLSGGSGGRMGRRRVRLPGQVKARKAEGCGQRRTRAFGAREYRRSARVPRLGDEHCLGCPGRERHQHSAPTRAGMQCGGKGEPGRFNHDHAGAFAHTRAGELSRKDGDSLVQLCPRGAPAKDTIDERKAGGVGRGAQSEKVGREGCAEVRREGPEEVGVQFSQIM